jgi:hypothetical protein
VALALLAGSLIPSTPLSAVAGRAEQSKTQKQNQAAAKRLQRQREHMENQRKRLMTNRQRFKDKRETLRAKVKALKAEAKAKAEEEDDETNIWSGFFPWVTAGDFSDNLPTGLGLAALGVAGALVLIFGLLGSLLPSMGGKAGYDALMLEIGLLAKRRDNQIKPRESYVRSEADLGPEQRQEASNLTHDLTRMIESKEAEARHMYRQLMWLGIPIYIVIGGALAVLLASTALQALLIGFAWTSIADRLGLKRELGEKRERKEEKADILEKEAKEGAKAQDKMAAQETEIQGMKQTVSELTKAIAKLKG